MKICTCYIKKAQSQYVYEFLYKKNDFVEVCKNLVTYGSENNYYIGLSNKYYIGLSK